MKLTAVIFMTAVLGFFAFQNCQKAPAPDDLSNNSILSDDQVNLSDLKLKEIDLNIDESQTVVRNSGSYQIIVNKVFKINLETGHILVSSDLDLVQNEFCLTEDLKNELNSILKSSQICKTGESKPGVLCAQAIQPGYAELITEKETYKLGYSSDGCGSNGFDLCGEQKNIIKAYIASVKANYKSFICH